MKWLALISGSALGGVARYLVNNHSYIMARNGHFPYGTLVANLTGCFLIGAFVGFAETRFMRDPAVKLFLMVGFCGALTTFSTFILDASSIMKNGAILKSFVYLIVSVTGGFGLFLLGTLLARTTV